MRVVFHVRSVLTVGGVSCYASRFYGLRWRLALSIVHSQASECAFPGRAMTLYRMEEERAYNHVHFSLQQLALPLHLVRSLCSALDRPATNGILHKFALARASYKPRTCKSILQVSHLQGHHRSCTSILAVARASCKHHLHGHPTSIALARASYRLPPIGTMRSGHSRPRREGESAF